MQVIRLLRRLYLCEDRSESECFALWGVTRPDYESIDWYHFLYPALVIIVWIFGIVIKWKHAEVCSLNKKDKC